MNSSDVGLPLWMREYQCSSGAAAAGDAAPDLRAKVDALALVGLRCPAMLDRMACATGCD